MQNNHFVFFLYISFTILLSPRLICKLNISENAIVIISIGDSFEITYRKIASKKNIKIEIMPSCWHNLDSIFTCNCK